MSRLIGQSDPAMGSVIPRYSLSNVVVAGDDHNGKSLW
jgi:hypothetical protein